MFDVDRDLEYKSSWTLLARRVFRERYGLVQWFVRNEVDMEPGGKRSQVLVYNYSVEVDTVVGVE